MARPLWLGRLRFARPSTGGGTTEAPAARPLGPSPFVRSVRKIARNFFLRLQNFIGLIFLVVEGIVAVRIIFKATGESAGWLLQLHLQRELTIRRPFPPRFH